MPKPDDLLVYERSHALTLAVYSITRGFPRGELYGLARQMRSSASSVPMNIAEGCGRSGDRELRRFVNIAHGSLVELEYQLRLAYELGYVDSRLTLGSLVRPARLARCCRACDVA